MVRQPSLLNGIVLAALLLSGCEPKVSDEYRAADEIIESSPANKESAEPTAQPAGKTMPAEIAAKPTETTKPDAPKAGDSGSASQTPPVESKAMPAASAEGTSPAVANTPATSPTISPVTPTTSPAEAMPANATPATPAVTATENKESANKGTAPAEKAAQGDKPASATPSKETASTGNGAPAMSANTPPLDPTAPPKVTGPLEIKLLIPEKVFTPEGPENALRVSFDDLDLLKVLNMEPVPPNAADHFPEWLKNLNGKRIILRGWMYPPARQEGIGSFLFVRDNGICCFGRAPKVYDKLGVKLRSGVTTRYIQNRPFDVIGTLSIEPEIEGDDEGLWWLYFINDAIIVDSQ